MRVSQNARRCGKHGAVRHQASLLWNSGGAYHRECMLWSPQTSLSVLMGSMRGELHSCWRQPDLAQHHRPTATCYYCGCHRQWGTPHQGKSYVAAKPPLRKCEECCISKIGWLRTRSLVKPMRYQLAKATSLPCKERLALSGQ